LATPILAPRPAKMAWLVVDMDEAFVPTADACIKAA
jgi:hypothetical protein